MTVQAFIGVGSNIDPAENLGKALELLAREVHVTALSTVYRTRADGREGDPDYLNCVVAVETDLAPLDLRDRVLRRIERRLGRVRSTDPFASRTMDLDLIIYGELVFRQDGLELPDPLIEKRPFLAIPLFETAPGLVIRGTERPVAEIAAAMPRNQMVALPELTARLRRKVCG